MGNHKMLWSIRAKSYPKINQLFSFYLLHIILFQRNIIPVQGGDFNQENANVSSPQISSNLSIAIIRSDHRRPEATIPLGETRQNVSEHQKGFDAHIRRCQVLRSQLTLQQF